MQTGRRAFRLSLGGNFGGNIGYCGGAHPDSMCFSGRCSIPFTRSKMMSRRVPWGPFLLPLPGEEAVWSLVTYRRIPWKRSTSGGRFGGNSAVRRTSHPQVGAARSLILAGLMGGCLLHEVQLPSPRVESRLADDCFPPARTCGEGPEAQVSGAVRFHTASTLG